MQYFKGYYYHEDEILLDRFVKIPSFLEGQANNRIKIYKTNDIYNFILFTSLGGIYLYNTESEKRFTLFKKAEIPMYSQMSEDSNFLLKGFCYNILKIVQLKAYISKVEERPEGIYIKTQREESFLLPNINPELQNIIKQIQESDYSWGKDIPYYNSEYFLRGAINIPARTARIVCTQDNITVNITQVSENEQQW